MIHCLIVEDEPLARNILEKFIRETDDLDLLGFAKDGQEAFEIISNEKIDLIFLDINLPKITGINLYKSLVEKPAVIFTTAYPEHAVEGFNLNAVDYLLKPFSFERFMEAISKARKFLETEKEHSVLVIKVDKKIHRIDLNEIFHIESLGDYIKIHTKNKTYISGSTMKSMEDELPSSKFIRIHKSHMVAIDQMDYMEGNQVLIHDKKIPVGQSYRDSLSKYFRK